MASLVTAQVGNGVTYVELTGALDIWSAVEVRQGLTAAIDQAGGAPRLAVDLRRVSFVDSTGLGVLVGALKNARQSHGSMTLICTEGHPLRILTRTGLTKVFHVYPSPEALLAATY